MKMNKKILGLTTVMILLPVLVGCFFWDRLPETMATHFDFSNQVNGFSSRGFTVLVFLVFCCLYIGFVYL